jgi:putative Holliday junction resolvase
MLATMRVMALDYGTRRVGVAISDALGVLARPLGSLPAQPFPELVAALQRLIQEHEVERIIVGLPRNMNGTYGPAAAAVQTWVAELQPHLPVPVMLWDERLTTVQAHRRLREAGHSERKRRQRVDSSAAAILLQSYLDRVA